jgi:putative peptidoglycan lipid II flippase
LLYALGLFSYSAVKILVPTFYALNDTRTPVRMSMISVGAKIALNFAMIFPLGFLGLALATTTASWLNYGLLLNNFRRRTAGSSSTRKEVSVYMRIALAAVVMGLLSLAVFRASWIIWAGPGVPAQSFRLALAIVAAIAALLPLYRIFRIEEGNQILRLIATLIGKTR